MLTFGGSSISPQVLKAWARLKKASGTYILCSITKSMQIWQGPSRKKLLECLLCAGPWEPWFTWGARDHPRNRLARQMLWWLVCRWASWGSGWLVTSTVSTVSRWWTWSWNLVLFAFDMLCEVVRLCLAVFRCFHVFGIETGASGPCHRTFSAGKGWNSTFICCTRRALAWNFDKKVLLLTEAWRPQQHENNKKKSIL